MGWVLWLISTLSLTAKHFVYRDLTESFYQAQYQDLFTRVSFLWSGRRQDLLGREQQRWGIRFAFPHMSLWAGFRGIESRIQITREHTRYFHNQQWTWINETSYATGIWRWLPTVTIQRYRGSTRHPENLGMGLRGNAEGHWRSLPISLQLRAYAQTLTQGGYLQWRVRPRWWRARFRIGGTFEHLRYPLTYAMETRKSQEFSGRVNLPTWSWFPQWQLKIQARHQTYTWNRTQNGLDLTASLHLQQTWGPWNWEYQEQRTWQTFEIYKNGESFTLQRRGSVAFSTLSDEGKGMQGRLAIVFTQITPPNFLSFNAHDRRAIRLLLQDDLVVWGILRVRFHGQARFVDEVFLHPMRSAYTRRDEEYRIASQVLGPSWSNETTISAWYSLFRFQPAQNLFIRYLEDTWTWTHDAWSFTGRLRLQENGTYSPSIEGPDLFYVQRKISEVQGQMTFALWRSNSLEIYAVLGRYDRWERLPKAAAKATRSETTVGSQFSSNWGEGEILWHQRLRDKDYLSLQLSLHLSF